MKSKANKIISLSFAAIMIFSSAAISYGASKDITRTNIFYSKTKKYEYAAQKAKHTNLKILSISL